MARLIWAPSAAKDVHRLYLFLNSANPRAAREAIAAIRRGVGVLAQQPRLGRPVENMPLEFRDWLIDFGESGYVARYRLEGEMVIILAVRHQKEAGFD